MNVNAYRVEINSELCKACYYCKASCPKKVIDLSGKLNTQGYAYVEPVRPQDCVGCLTCIGLCPDFAIKILDA